jgi:cytochrome c-type biogenesis protein CcmE
MTDERDDPGAGHGFDESQSPDLDLTPRTGGGAAPARARKKRRPVGAYAVLALIVAGIGFVVFQGLGNATLYFRNVDEAVAHRDELGTRRFRLQGLVVDDVNERDGVVTFDVAFNGAELPVRHVGDPPDLFRPGQPVVLEGHFAEGSDVFESDRILVKHDEDYTDEHEDRLVDAEDGRSTAP